MNVLEEADKIIHGERNADYGSPLDNHTTTANLLTLYLAAKYHAPFVLDAEDVCWFNVLQKVSREVTAGAKKRDTLVDVCGYIGNIEMVRDEQERRQ